MYKSNKLGLIDWLILLVLLAIPVVNIIVGILLYLSPGTSRTVKNFLLAVVIILVAGIILNFTTGVLATITDFIGGF